MADSNMTPHTVMGIRSGVRQPAVKPMDLKGTLRRLWKMTSGSRKGLGWLLLFSAFASVSAILSPPCDRACGKCG